jgi:fatty acid CoA ligase FadD9
VSPLLPLLTLGALGIGLYVYLRRENFARGFTYWRMRIRIANLARKDPELRAASPTSRDLRWIGAGAEHGIELVARACQRYRERPCLASRCPEGEYVTVSFAQLWQRVVSFAGGLHEEVGVRPGDLVGIRGPCSIEWVVADLACLYLGAVSVPLAQDLTVKDLEQVLGESRLTCLVCDQDAGALASHALTVTDMSRLERRGEFVEYVLPRKGELFSIVCTSGSTGEPKGVMFSQAQWTQTLREALNTKCVPRVSLGYLPLSHMAGRAGLYKILMAGGLSYLIAKSDMSTLFEDLRRARPTQLLLVPRLSQILYQWFQSQYVKRGGQPGSARAMLRTSLGQKLAREMRDSVLGGRFCFAYTGAAPTSSELRDFLEHGLDVHLTDLYGSTELGSLAINGRIQPWLDYKLIDRPELGFTRKDKPFPRGELAIRSPRATGYYRDRGAGESLMDNEGYVLTGDIVEERGSGRIVWLERSTNVLRLSHGKFVNVSELEHLFTSSSPYIDQVYLYGDPLKDCLLAVIVPNCSAPLEGDLRVMLRSELGRIGVAAELASYEIPRDFLVEPECFSESNGLLSSAGKPRRPRLKTKYQARLEELYQEIERRRSQDQSAPERDFQEHLLCGVSKILGLRMDEIDSRATFLSLGGDSLGAVQLRQWLEDEGVKVSVGDLLRYSLADLSRRKPNRLFERLHGTDVPWVRAHTFRARNLLPPELLRPLRIGSEQPKVVMLTGATGFLGRSLCLELLARLPHQGKLICLVRAQDKKSSMERLESAFSDQQARERFRQLQDSSRLEVWNGDFEEENLGLAEVDYMRLKQQVQVVLHVGALVNHALQYEDLFSPNVLGTLHLARFALGGTPKRLHFVSTLALAGGASRKVPVSEDQSASKLWKRRPMVGTRYADGYVTSKWASELLLEDLHEETGLPVTISRCSMILPHREFPGEHNASDLFCRLFFGILRTGLAPRSFYRGSGARHYDGLPVDVVAGFLAELAIQPVRGLQRFHVSNAHWDDGVSLDRMVDWVGKDVPIERCPYGTFLARFQRALQELGEHDKRRSPLSMIDHWHQPLEVSRAKALVQSPRFHAEYKKLFGRETESLTEGYIRRSMAAVREMQGPLNPQDPHA